VTVRDPEVLEVLRTEPELLALADAVRETQRAPRRRLAGTRPRLAAVGAVVVVAILAVLFVPDRAARPGVIGRALAAIGNGRVLHLRTETPSGLVYVELKSGHRTIDTVQNEVWFDRDTNRFHFLMEAHGRVGDIVWPDDAKSGDTFDPSGIDPAFTALWAGYREALANGDAKLERKDVLDGRPVYWLRFQSSQPGTPGTEVAIDRRTYKPVLFREHYPNGQRVDERVLVAETLDYSEAEFKRRGPNLFDGVGSSGGGYSMDLPPKQPVVKAPWLTAGDSVIGLPLRAVNQLSTRENGRTFLGVVLIYGDVKRTPSELTIEQLRSPSDPVFWNAIPPNAVAIQRSTSTVGQSQKQLTQWTGSFLRDGVYASIETTRGEQALLDVARALRRAP
jgi:hypothetical protein